jgi:hypothetical protein
MKKFEHARYFKRTLVKRKPVYDRRDACLAGLWLHTWHMDAAHQERVVRTKFASSRAAKLAFNKLVRALVADGCEAHDKTDAGWSINPRGLRGYHHEDGTWGWPKKWDAKVTVEIVDATAASKKPAKAAPKPASARRAKPTSRRAKPTSRRAKPTLRRAKPTSQRGKPISPRAVTARRSSTSR